MAASSVVLTEKGSEVAHSARRNFFEAAQSACRTIVKVAGVWYRAEAFPNAVPGSSCELGCGWGHKENKCGNKP